MLATRSLVDLQREMTYVRPGRARDLKQLPLSETPPTSRLQERHRVASG